MEIKYIIANIRAGKLDWETDERNAGGFWDLAGLFVEDLEIEAARKNELQRDICGYYGKLTRKQHIPLEPSSYNLPLVRAEKQQEGVWKSQNWF